MKDNFRTHAQNLALAKKVREMLKHSFAVQMTKEEAILKGPVPQTMFLESVDKLADENIFRGGTLFSLRLMKSFLILGSSFIPRGL